MSSPSELCLHVISCSCNCGNKWTHSHLWLSGNGILGGTPHPSQEEKFPLTSIAESKYMFNHCFRCVGLHVGIGWQKPPPLSPDLTPTRSVVQQGPRRATGNRPRNFDEGIF